MAIGHLHLLWWWTLEYRMDGVLTDLNDAEIAEAAEYQGDPKRFVNALVEAKLIDRGDGVLAVHDWFDFCGEVVRKRLHRLQDKRLKSADIGRQRPPTQPHPTIPNRTKPNQGHNTVSELTETPGPKQPECPVKGTEVVDVKGSLSLLLSLGLSRAKAAGYASAYPFERIKSVCTYAKTGKHPAGLALKALEKGWKV